MTDTSLPDVMPLSCAQKLTFVEINRAITELMMRDRVLEEAVLAFTDEAFLQNTVKVLSATEVILGSDLMQAVIAANNMLPVGVQDFQTFQSEIASRVTSLEDATTVTSGSQQPLSLKSVVEGTQTTLAALNTAIEAFAAELAAIKAVTDSISSLSSTVTAMEKRLADAEALLADLSDEVKQARKEFATDPSKRLIDKIDAIDSNILALQQTTDALQKEIVDARSADRFDTLAERLGSIESSIETLQDTINNLSGKGNVNGLRVGRSILHGEVEIIPGSGIAITRERNGLRIDVADSGTCVDLGAPKIDANNGCCGPGNPNFGN
jgi:hypothetical protein